MHENYQKILAVHKINNVDDDSSTPEEKLKEYYYNQILR